MVGLFGRPEQGDAATPKAKPKQSLRNLRLKK